MLIEPDFGQPSLAQRDSSANNLFEVFDFSQAPRAPLVLPGSYAPDHYPLANSNATSTSATHSYPAGAFPMPIELEVSVLVVVIIVGLLTLFHHKW